MHVSSGIFMSYVQESLTAVTDRKLSSALLSGFTNNIDRIHEYSLTYRDITSSNWTIASLCSFFCGWRSPDGAAHAVASIMIRLLQESVDLPEAARKLLLLEAARHCGEIIVEDVGLGEMHHHPHHSKLYYAMASAVCGSDDWRLQDRFLDPITKEFSGWVGQQRPLAPDLMQAIEMMIMTEIFNTGEYNLMTPMWKTWLVEQRGHSKAQANKICTFLSVHCGHVEAQHFSHATDALMLYAQAHDRPIEYDRIAALSHEYVVRACEHLGKMASVLERQLAAA